MSEFLREDAMQVAIKVLKVVNAFKEAVGLPITPMPADITMFGDDLPQFLEDERFAGIMDGVLHAWEHPEQTAQMNHDSWMERMIENGWVRGEVLSEEAKTHPALVGHLEVPLLYKVNDILFLAIVNANKPQLTE